MTVNTATPVQHAWAPEVVHLRGDLRLAHDQVDLVRRSLSRNGLVVLRVPGHFSIDDQVWLTRQFGYPEKAFDVDLQHPLNPLVHVMQRPASEQRGRRRSSSYYWHVDRSFTQDPSVVSLLRAVDLPDRENRTDFCFTRHFVEATDDRDLAVLVNQSLTHDYALYHRVHQREHFSPEDIEERARRFPPIRRSLIVTSPADGRPSLYVNELCGSKVDDLSEAASIRYVRSIVDRLTANPGRLYTHSWAPGDLLLWDNYSVMHRGVPGSGRRIMHRTSAGPSTSMEYEPVRTLGKNP